MSDLRKAAEMALAAWDWDESEPRNKMLRTRMKTLRQALSHPEQEPVAYVSDSGSIAVMVSGTDLDDDTPLYTEPPKREWVGLTDEDLFDYPTIEIGVNGSVFDSSSFAKMIETKLKEKNT